MSRSLKWCVSIAAILLPYGCSSDDATPRPPHELTDAAAGGSTADGGTGAVVCGGKTCVPPLGSGIEGITTCCLDDDSCGLKLPTVDKCFPRDIPGSSTSPECPRPTYTTPGGDVLAACCGASGCGALDPFIGCIPSQDMGGAATACAYDPTNDCTALSGVTCDGSEDCPTGQRCCGKLVRNTRYVEFGCFDSCNDPLEAGVDYRLVELCHPADGCENPSYQCRASSILPAPFTRCDATGGFDPDPSANTSAEQVNCGKGVCNSGEKCCIRTPHTPYCTKADEPCECHPDGLLDGGTTIVPASDGGKPAIPTEAGPRDAAVN